MVLVVNPINDDQRGEEEEGGGEEVGHGVWVIGEK
jgi:hypothetical protein